MAYRLGMTENGYSSELGLSKLATYADMYGLSETSGIEIEEYTPQISDTDAVRSAIGQGSNNFTTVGLARYVTTVANSGTCYNLTLIDKITDRNGNLLKDNQAEIRNTVDLTGAEWNAIHTGMRQVVESKSYYSDLKVNVAGKTGTAEESKSRANHALFVCYAPYENPEISIAVRIPFGYTSANAAHYARNILSYYFEVEEKDALLDGQAVTIDSSSNAVND